MRSVQLLSLLLILSSCLREEEFHHPFGTFAPMEIGDGLILSSPSAEQVDSLRLVEIFKSAYNQEAFWSLRSMLVFRHNHLIAEYYFNDLKDITNQRLIWSCTKQVMGMLAGAAIDQNILSSINDPIGAYLPQINSHQDKAAITVRHLLTMQSGIDFENDGLGGETHQVLQQNPPDLTEFVLSLPMIYDPGTHFYYKDGDPQLLSAVLQNATNRPADELAEELIFSKIGFSNYNWVRYPDGTAFGGFGIETTPRELAKLGQLVLDSGMWNGEQVISKEWIGKMTSSQVETGMEDYEFGYYWWIDKKENIHFMWGHGGQFVFVVPEKDLLVVLTSIPNTQGGYQISADEVLPLVYEIMDISR